MQNYTYQTMPMAQGQHQQLQQQQQPHHQQQHLAHQQQQPQHHQHPTTSSATLPGMGLWIGGLPDHIAPQPQPVSLQQHQQHQP